MNFFLSGVGGGGVGGGKLLDRKTQKPWTIVITRVGISTNPKTHLGKDKPLTAIRFVGY